MKPALRPLSDREEETIGVHTLLEENHFKPATFPQPDSSATGDFVADIDLSIDHKAPADDDYLRFRDISYAAYFTDPTTGRSEHRRFDSRLTKDRIHI